MKMNEQPFDVAIVGAGVVGLTLAAILAKAEMRVVVFERGSIPVFDMAKDYGQRVSAITVASEMIFRHLGVWQSMLNQRVGSFREMFVWEHQGDAYIHFNCATIAKDHLGHIIENNLMQAVLYQFCQQQEQISIMTECVLDDVQVDADKINLFDSTGRVWQARLAVAADGVNSWLRQKMAFPIKKRDYHHHALVSTVKTERSHQQTAWQCFLPQGVLAFLPLSDPNTCSIVWSSTPKHIDYLMQLDEQQFKRELAGVYSGRLGQIQSFSQRATFPLHMSHAKYYVKPRVALIGDAAHSIHPLAGQGMNLGLWDAAILAEVLIKTHTRQRDFSLEHYLREYQRRRQNDNRMMLAAMDGFKCLFTSQQPIVQQIRHAGLKITNRVLPLKHWFMRRAMGLLGDLPIIAR